MALNFAPATALRRAVALRGTKISLDSECQSRHTGAHVIGKFTSEGARACGHARFSAPDGDGRLLRPSCLPVKSNLLPRAQVFARNCPAFHSWNAIREECIDE